MTEISIAAPLHPLSAYLATPGGTGPWPGIVVVHDIFGQGADNRRQADWLAAAGYLTVAPDFYSWGWKPRCIQATMRDLMAKRGTAFDDIEASRQAVATRADCTGNVGVIGFCMGGGFALVAAARRGFAVSSVNYGQVPKDAEALLRGACPIVGSFGGKDFTLKGAAAQLEHALTADDIPHDVEEYPDASHGFLNDHGGVTGWVLARFGIRFNAPAAADAKARILRFFEQHLH